MQRGSVKLTRGGIRSYDSNLKEALQRWRDQLKRTKGAEHSQLLTWALQALREQDLDLSKAFSRIEFLERMALKMQRDHAQRALELEQLRERHEDLAHRYDAIMQRSR